MADSSRSKGEAGPESGYHFQCEEMGTIFIGVRKESQQEGDADRDVGVQRWVCDGTGSQEEEHPCRGTEAGACLSIPEMARGAVVAGAQEAGGKWWPVGNGGRWDYRKTSRV